MMADGGKENDGIMSVQTMNTSAEITPDFISRAVDEIRTLKSDYRLLLDLYEMIFIEQEKSKKSLRLARYAIPEKDVALKQREKFPLVEISQFGIDAESAKTLFSIIAGILISKDSELSVPVKKIIDVVDTGGINSENIFSAFLGGNEPFFASMENEFSLDVTVLSFLVYNSLKPSLNRFSKMIAGYLEKDMEWDRGYCPVCGSLPELSVFEDDGKRSLLCGFCGHRWQSKRVYCPFCENTDHETLRYYEIEEEEEYRVDVCDKCHGYIKTVDVKKISRPLYLPLESIATPYIDLKFKEMGYRPGNMACDR